MEQSTKTYTVSTDIDTHDITRLFSPYYKFIQIEEGGKYSITFLSNIESFILPKITLEIKNMKNREHLSVDPKLIEQKFIERAGSRKILVYLIYISMKNLENIQNIIFQMIIIGIDLVTKKCTLKFY